MEKLKTKTFNIPVMKVGRYAGTPVDKLPFSYLRWIITQDFSKDIVDAAKEKLKDSSYYSEHISISRHTYDQFSMRFLDKWNDKSVGFGTFVAREAEKAWDKGKNISMRRHKHDGIVKALNGVAWVFNVSPNFPDYKDVITCYELE